MGTLVAVLVIGSVALLGSVTNNNYCSVHDEWRMVDVSLTTPESCED